MRLHQILFDIVNAGGDTVKGIAGAFILFYKEVFESSLIRIGKYFLEVDNAIANFGKSMSGGIVHIL